MRVGYSYWGFLGDHKLDADGNELSTPDGNATYSWSIVHELLRRGHNVYMMQDDRDVPGHALYGTDNFESFSAFKRAWAYEGMKRTGGTQLPDLDVLLLEWRFPIPGRNIDPGAPGFQPDLKRQTELLEHYATKDTKIVVWDLDHKLTWDEEVELYGSVPRSRLEVIETSVRPRHQYMSRTRVEPPFVVEDLLQHPTLPADPDRMLVYVGSRYERDDVITEYVLPSSDAFPGRVHFYGNWQKTIDECKRLWPGVAYHDRITTRDFRGAYGTAVACPLLAKRSYFQTGFVTPRVWEALLFGTIPVGFTEMYGGARYVVRSADFGDELAGLLEELSEMSLQDRDRVRRENVEKISFMDSRYFVDTILQG